MCSCLQLLSLESTNTTWSVQLLISWYSRLVKNIGMHNGHGIVGLAIPSFIRGEQLEGLRDGDSDDKLDAQQLDLLSGWAVICVTPFAAQEVFSACNK